jgi:hypothetical protein
VRLRWGWVLLSISLLLCPTAAKAQLLSPGKLAAPHGDLNGLRKCTNCHSLGERGVSNEKCLGCHELLRKRIAERAGFHATVEPQNCAECHKDHFGVDFALVRLDTTSFDHAEVGYQLAEAHSKLPCGDCHQRQLINDPEVRSLKGEHGALDRTFLGLGTTCVACHEADDPHAQQFGGRACQECHTETVWDGAERFDHDQSDYRLTGLHRRVDCEDCHRPSTAGAAAEYVRYAGLNTTSCSSCHEDVHRGRMEGTCAGCHTTAGWHRLNRSRFESRFDHEATEFSLVGRHADIECESCHGRRRAEREGLRLSFGRATRGNAYPTPEAADCLSCHLDFHQSVFQQSVGGPLCQNCHTQTDWLPTTYDLARHNDGSTFELSGAHVVTPCQECHVTPGDTDSTLNFRFADSECRSCHESDDPHRGQFADARCTSCHTTDSYAVESFDHTTTRYPLDGAHRDVACNDCHALVRGSDGGKYRMYKPLGTECTDCHGGAR